MRWNGFPIITACLAFATAATPLNAAAFGTVAAIGGHASDIALDEARGLLYIANFTANRIDVLSTSDNTVHTSINVSPQPGSIALSPDAQYLLIAHFGNTNPPDPSKNLLTLIRLSDNTRQTFITGDPALGVAFYGGVPNGPGKALVVTTTGFFTMDPTNGVISPVISFANLAGVTPVPAPTFPGQILQTALTTSADRMTVWGVAGAGTGNQVLYKFDARTGLISITVDVSSPPLLNRVSVSADGAYAMIGWAMFSGGVLTARYPNVLTSTNVTGHAFDSKNGLLYAQIPDVNQPSGPPYYSPNQSAGAASSVALPTLLVMESDNLTVRDRIVIPENMVGRAVLNANATTMYAVSDSGVMVLPVGSLNQYHRVTAQAEDVLLQTSFCNRGTIGQSLTIVDPSGGKTDFSISSSQAGVSVTPSQGTTPMTVQVVIDPAKFQTKGTTAVTLTITSSSSINMPRSVRLLVNNPDQNQRGQVVNVPGVLADILPDPVRNRYYILRQDVNQLLIYDGSNNQKIVALRTATTPTMMAFTNDQKYLMVTHNDSQLVTVYDLDKMQAISPIILPGGHYGRSVASSNSRILVLARDEGSGQGVVDVVNFGLRTASAMGKLGIYVNNVSPTAVLTGSPNGRNIMLASPDGTVMLYSADADTFTIGRKDLPSLQGAFAASSYDTYVVGNTVFNASLVPTGAMDASLGTTSGFAFVGQGGYRVTASASASAGAIQNLPALVGTSVNPIPMSEAPLLPGKDIVFTRTVAPMPSAGTIVALTVSGFTVLANNYDAAVAPPSISKVLNAADGSANVAPGGLISIYGAQMSPTNVATQTIPLPTAINQSCLTVNGSPIPLLFVSPGQVNAQLPFNIAGTATMSIHTPGGVSNNYNFTILGTAPAVFMSGAAGPQTGLATIIRADNGELVTPTNPIHENDTVVIYLTGLGATFPPVPEGVATPIDLLSFAASTPTVTLGGHNLNVLYAGLVPGSVSGLYQINATVPGGVPQGVSIPLIISQGVPSSTLNVRVVK